MYVYGSYTSGSISVLKFNKLALWGLTSEDADDLQGVLGRVKQTI